VEAWVLLCALVSFVAWVVWRWRRLNTRLLSDAQAETLTQQLEEDVFQFVPEPAAPIQVPASYWRDIGGRRTAIEVSRWAIGRGRITAPGWDLISILSGQPPRSVALTRKSFERLSSPPPQPAWVSYGPVTVTGGQIVLGGTTVELTQLHMLAETLDLDSASLGLADGELLRARAAALRRAVAAGDINAARGVLTWIRDRLNEASGNALGSGLFLLTQAAFRSLFG
jgi:hypothetical protein